MEVRGYAVDGTEPFLEGFGQAAWAAEPHFALARAVLVKAQSCSIEYLSLAGAMHMQLDVRKRGAQLFEASDETVIVAVARAVMQFGLRRLFRYALQGLQPG